MRLAGRFPLRTAALVSFFLPSLLARPSPLPVGLDVEGGFSVEFSRRSFDQAVLSPEDRLAALMKGQKKLRGKFNQEWREEDESGLRKRAAVGEANLAGNEGSYYGSIAVGTPAVLYEVGFDTGSADLVLATAVSDTCGDVCTPTAELYSPANSNTSVELNTPIDITYGTGEASGVLVQDHVSFAGFEATQTFAACGNVTDLTTSPDQSGLFGLGWHALAESKAVPFVQALWQDGLLTSPVFGFGLRSLDFNDVAQASSVVSGGIMTIGGVNTTLFTGSLNYVPLSDSGTYWDIPLTSLSVSGQSTGLTGAVAIIDTGTNSVAVPPSLAQAIYSLIPNAQVVSQSGGIYAYPCSTDVTLTLTFGGQDYTMASKYFNSGPADSQGEYCYGAVTLSGETEDAPIIIGTPFLMGFYIAFQFSPAAVGFAPIADPSSVLEHVPIPTSNGTGTGPDLAPVTDTTTRSTTSVSATSSSRSTSRSSSSSSSETSTPSSTPSSSGRVQFQSAGVLLVAGALSMVMFA